MDADPEVVYWYIKEKLLEVFKKLNSDDKLDAIYELLLEIKIGR